MYQLNCYIQTILFAQEDRWITNIIWLTRFLIILNNYYVSSDYKIAICCSLAQSSNQLLTVFLRHSPTNCIIYKQILHNNKRKPAASALMFTLRKLSLFQRKSSTFLENFHFATIPSFCLHSVHCSDDDSVSPSGLWLYVGPHAVPFGLINIMLCKQYSQRRRLKPSS